MRQYNRIFSSYLGLLGLLTSFVCSFLQAATPPGLPNPTELSHARQGGNVRDRFSLPSSANKMVKEVNLLFSSTESQTIPIFTDNIQVIRGLSITGHVILQNNKTSYLRVILVDNSQHSEYLVYETYPGLVDSLDFPIQEVCEETCVLSRITNFSLRVELENASIDLQELIYTDSVSISAEASDESDDSIRRVAKIQKLNEQNLGWVAGETSISKMSYQEKKHLFLKPVVPNLNGFEFYSGGVFEIPYNTSSHPGANTLVTSFNWGNRHGENWITPVKNQGQCGSCWAFAATGATEAVANLYFNQHLNLDLAEQDALSCSGAGSCNGGLPSRTLDFFTTTGIVGEQCFPYSMIDKACNKCSSPKELIKIGGKRDFKSPKSEDTLKQMIIESGPVSGGILSLSHAMTLIGFETDPKDGRIVWIFKNSWGQNWGSGLLDGKWGEGNAERGYAHVKLNIDNIEWTHAIQLPITSINGYQINCVDKDNDQFCNWGLSKNKPASCPSFCKATEDCDDSNPKLTSFDASYNCGSGDNNPLPTPTEKKFTIYNDGNADLVIGSILPATSVPWLSILTLTPFTIPPGGSKTVPVQITASAPNSTVRLLVNSNDPDENPYPNGINIEVRRQSGSLPILPPPISPGSSLIELESGKSINPAGVFANSNTSFKGGASTDKVNYQTYLTTSPSSDLTVKGHIIVDPADVGKQADLLYVAGFENQAPFDGGADTTYFTIDESENLSTLDLYNQPSVWMNQLATKPFKRNVTLQQEMVMDEVNAGQLLTKPSVNYYFMGYRLQNGTLVYTSVPIIVNVQ